MPHEQLRIGSLFTGYGGLDLAVEQFFGARTVWTCDNDPGACKIIAHRYPDIPNLGDITKVDWAAVEPIDILTGGFPCQDVSHAGLRAGMRTGTRSGLWAQMAHAIDRLRPRYVVAENVRGLLSARADSDLEPCPWCVGGAADGEPDLRALGCVLADLADLGYDARWVGLRAADVGAPHGRFRVFILAENADSTVSGERWLATPRQTEGGRARADAGRRDRTSAADADCLQPAGRGGVRDVGGAAEDRSREAQQRQRGRDATHHRGTATADAASNGRHERWSEPARLIRGSDAAKRGTTTADAAFTEWRGAQLKDLGTSVATAAESGECPSSVAWGVYASAVERWERLLDRPAPSPTVLSETYLARRARRLAKRDKRPVGMRGSLAPVRHLSPRFVEWMQGLPAGWVTDVPGLSRNAQLAALGNGCVPQQVGLALRLMTEDVR